MPYKDICSKLGIKKATVASIVYNYKHKLLNFEMDSDREEPPNKKLTNEVLKLIFETVVRACQRKELMTYKILQEKIK